MKVRTLIWALEQRIAAGDLTGEEEVVDAWGKELDFAVVTGNGKTIVVIDENAGSYEED